MVPLPELSVRLTPLTSAVNVAEVCVVVEHSGLLWRSSLARANFSRCGPTAYQRLSPMWISCGFDVSFQCSDGDWKAIGAPTPGLAESGQPGCNRSDGGGCVTSG